MKAQTRGLLVCILAWMSVSLIPALSKETAPEIRIIESEIRLEFEPTVQIVLPVANSSEKELKGFGAKENQSACT